MENNEKKNPIKQPVKPVTPKTAPKGVPKTAPKGIPTNVGQNAEAKNLASKQNVSNAELNKPKVKEIDSKTVAHKEDNTENKKKNRKLLLLLLLLLLIAGGVGTAIYFITKIPKTEIQFSIITKVEYTQKTEQDEVTGEIKDYLYLPGDDIDVALNIDIDNDKGVITSSETVYLRFRIDIIVDGNNYYGGLFDPEFTNPDEWQYSSDDDYFYYKYVCYGDEEFTPFEKINFVAERYNNVLNGKSGQIVFVVEILEGNSSAISALWQTAPSSWKPTTRN